MDTPTPLLNVKPPSRMTRMTATVRKHAKKKSVIGISAAIALTSAVSAVNALKPAELTRYVLQAVERGTLVVSVSGSGQVSDENQLDLTPPATAKVTAVNVKPGDQVKAGDVLVVLDPGDAQKTVRDASQSVYDASLSLKSAQIALDRLNQTDATSLLRAEDTYAQAERALQDLENPDAEDVRQAELDLAIKENAAKLGPDGMTPERVRDSLDAAALDVKTAARAYDDALREVDSVLGVDSSVGQDDYAKLLGVMDANMLPQAQFLYAAAKTPVLALKKNAETLANKGADEADILAIADEGTDVGDALRALLDATLDVLANTVTSVDFSQSELNSLRSGVSSARSSVISNHDTLADVEGDLQDARSAYASAKLAADKARQALEILTHPDPADLASAQNSLDQAKIALDDLKAGPDTGDLASAQNTVAQRQSSLTTAANRLADARETLAEYTVRAPIDATVGDVSVKTGDQALASATLVTLLTKYRVAEMTVNEVDAVRIKPGQKATLTFDAIPDLSIAGTVSRVDGTGTVSQGVVTYGVVIAFDTNDDRVKPGMTVSTTIVTDAKTDALLVPAAAVQAATNGLATVQVLLGVSGDNAMDPAGVTSPTPPERLPVQTGLSNDQMTEITDGLNEGDLVIIRTINPETTTAAAPSSASAFGGLGGGTVRIQGAGGFTGGGNARFGTGR